MDFQCPSCRAQLAMKPTDAGKQMCCPYCMKEITVPRPSTVAPEDQPPGTALIRLPPSELIHRPPSEVTLVPPFGQSVSHHQLDMYAAPSVLHHPVGFLFVAIAAAGMLVFAISVSNVNDEPMKLANYSRSAVPEKSQAWAIAKRAVLQRLANPKSADFGDTSGDSPSGSGYARPDADGWVVSGWVKSIDDYGVTARKQWIVAIDGAGQVTRCDFLE